MDMPLKNYKAFGFWPAFAKRLFDIVVSLIVLVLFGWLIALAWLVAAFETRSNGFFIQRRIGREGKAFGVIKIKTMYPRAQQGSTVTAYNDNRVSASGRFFRKTKIDELPQLFNVLIGDMSLVGPRPDVPGFADILTEDDRVILAIRPGVTGPATLKYRNEEFLLATQPDPEKYNREVIFPDKVSLNKEYIRNYSFFKDIYYIFQTVLR